MIEFTITALPMDTEQQKGTGVKFKIQGSPSKTELESLKPYLTPKALKILSDHLGKAGK